MTCVAMYVCAFMCTAIMKLHLYFWSRYVFQQIMHISINATYIHEIITKLIGLHTTCIHTHTHTHTQTYTHIYTHKHTHTYTCTQTHTQSKHTCAHMCKYIYVYVQAYVYTHIGK